MGGAAVIINSEAEWTAALEKATAEGKAVSGGVVGVNDGKRRSIAFFFFSRSLSRPRRGLSSASLSFPLLSMVPP